MVDVELLATREGRPRILAVDEPAELVHRRARSKSPIIVDRPMARSMGLISSIFTMPSSAAFCHGCSPRSVAW